MTDTKIKSFDLFFIKFLLPENFYLSETSLSQNFEDSVIKIYSESPLLIST